MSLKNFRQGLQEHLFFFLWRQWSVLGVSGTTSAEEDWIVDPEALLVFSLPMARHEPRLFDEILAWLEVNGGHLDTARLRRILEAQDEETARVVGAVLQYMMSRGGERKWKNLVAECRKRCPAGAPRALFFDEGGKPHPIAATADQDFASFSLNRPVVKNLKAARPVPVDARANLRFLLRSLFGTGARSESILYLLTHADGARPREIADAVGLFWLGIHQTLQELSRSGLVLIKRSGRRVDYWLSHPKWWEFLSSGSYESAPLPKWLNWIAIFSALSSAWKTVDELAAGGQSDYLRSAKLQESLDIIGAEFSRAGLDVSRLPRAGLPGDLHQKLALRFIGEIFGVKDEVAAR